MTRTTLKFDVYFHAPNHGTKTVLGVLPQQESAIIDQQFTMKQRSEVHYFSGGSKVEGYKLDVFQMPRMQRGVLTSGLLKAFEKLFRSSF